MTDGEVDKQYEIVQKITDYFNLVNQNVAQLLMDFHDMRTQNRRLHEEIVKYREALNKIGHSEHYGGKRSVVDYRSIAIEALRIGK